LAEQEQRYIASLQLSIEKSIVEFLAFVEIGDSVSSLRQKAEKSCFFRMLRGEKGENFTPLQVLREDT
jgi:hypothetical protein